MSELQNLKVIIGAQILDYLGYYQKVIFRRSRSAGPLEEEQGHSHVQGAGFGHLLPEHCTNASFPGTYSGFLRKTTVICKKVWDGTDSPELKVVLMPSICTFEGLIFINFCTLGYNIDS